MFEDFQFTIRLASVTVSGTGRGKHRQVSHWFSLTATRSLFGLFLPDEVSTQLSRPMSKGSACNTGDPRHYCRCVQPVSVPVSDETKMLILNFLISSHDLIS